MLDLLTQAQAAAGQNTRAGNVVSGTCQVVGSKSHKQGHLAHPAVAVADAVTLWSQFNVMENRGIEKVRMCGCMTATGHLA
jgi:hypothetical protein